ncbi:uncharacterized protein LTR77_008910 [Saxophila tyrrhenica]|uniref:N-acetyltransferase domain-containing protein n=1 Tax=Saxophila tyrrhenica TaxID=1690608 RepID=A0AAV9P2E3_9PEZI|nr:hypothetical protein LTR77_008910 [Saxophila tyrrhenica]
MSKYQIVPARPSNISSLTTIVARSFHSTNPYIRAALPDTPSVREWWRNIFQHFLSDSSSWHVLTASAPSSESNFPRNAEEDEEEAIGVLVLRHMQPHERGSGAWSIFPLTSDHDAEKFNAMVSTMSLQRERIMRVDEEEAARKHYTIELFGVDNSWKGKGVGAALLRRACEVVDERGLETFVQANASARAFYEREGFQVRGSEVMPGEDKYEEFMLLRPAKTS